jgi:hypothetical protein
VIDLEFSEVKVGMRVKMDASHPDCAQFEHQHDYYMGTVTNIEEQDGWYGKYNISVEWDNGRSARYQHQSLIEVVEKDARI